MEKSEGVFAVGIASLVLGILSVLLAVCATWWASIILGVVGIVLGVFARRNHEGGMATAGFVLSIIGTSISVVCVFAWVALLSWLGKFFGTLF